MQLRAYQLAAADAVEAQHALVRATLLVLATGLGKTVTFAELVRRAAHRGGRALVVAHRSELVDQAAATLRRFGLSVKVEQGDQRVDVSTLPDVVVASVQTLRGRRLVRFPTDTFALLVIDEAHHATAPGYRQVVEHFCSAKVLGVTATPDRGDGVGLRNVFDSTAFRMDIGDGIDGGWLVPLELRSVRVDGLDLTAVRQQAGDFHVGQLEGALTNETVLRGIASPLAELCSGRQTLVFTAGVKQAHALAERLCQYGLRAAAVDGDTPSAQRAKLLHRYRTSEIQIVCNAMLWTEGFDAPETSCIALARPTRSRALLTQMIGRGTRLAPNKASCLVLDFEPHRAGRLRLASPADVLAGKELPDPLLQRLLARTRRRGGELRELLASARAELEHEALALLERQRSELEVRAERIREGGVIYAAPRMSTRELLSAIVPPERAGWNPRWRRKLATPSERNVLEKAGVEVPDDLTSRQARCLLELLKERRKRGMCSIRQARRLAALGLRDDLTFEDARAVIAEIAANEWRPPAWMYSDPRTARVSARRKVAV